MSDDCSKEERWHLLQEAKQDHYIDMLHTAHDRGEHDVQGEESPNCAACEARALDEAAELHELQDEENKK